MGDDRHNGRGGDRRISIGRMTGGLAQGDHAIAVGQGGSVSIGADAAQIAALTALVRSLLDRFPAEQRTHVADLADGLDREATAPTPSKGRLRELLATLRNVGEGTTGSLIASAIDDLF